VNLIRTLKNIGKSKKSFFNINGKSYINLDLIRKNILFYYFNVGEFYCNDLGKSRIFIYNYWVYKNEIDNCSSWRQIYIY
jgi:hypothetical protein